MISKEIKDYRRFYVEMCSAKWETRQLSHLLQKSLRKSSAKI